MLQIVSRKSSFIMHINCLGCVTRAQLLSLQLLREGRGNFFFFNLSGNHNTQTPLLTECRWGWPVKAPAGDQRVNQGVSIHQPHPSPSWGSSGSGWVFLGPQSEKRAQGTFIFYILTWYHIQAIKTYLLLTLSIVLIIKFLEKVYIHYFMLGHKLCILFTW